MLNWFRYWLCFLFYSTFGRVVLFVADFYAVVNLCVPLVSVPAPGPGPIGSGSWVPDMYDVCLPYKEIGIFLFMCAPRLTSD